MISSNHQSINFTSIPDELKSRDQWVLWQYEESYGRQTKVPYSATGLRAKITDPDSWCSFDVAKTNYERGDYDGIGFVFSKDDPYLGIDLDSCRDPLTGELSDWALPIVNSVDSYCEVSPSGCGVKIICKATHPQECGHTVKPRHLEASSQGKAVEIAVYDQDRYWCITGQRIDNVPANPTERQEAVNELCSEWLGKRVSASRRLKEHRSSQPVIDLRRRLIDKVRTTPQGQRSEADYHLIITAIKRKWDKEQLWSDIRHSGKFAERGREYFDRTWDKAARAAADQASKLCISRHEGRDDIANGRRLVWEHGDVIRWVELWQKWLVWDGRRWNVDESCQIDAMTKEVMERLYGDAEEICNRVKDEKVRQSTLRTLRAFAKSSCSKSGLCNAQVMARSEESIAILPSTLDQDPWLFNVQNGTLNLRTGELRPHDPDCNLTKLSPVTFDPDATCPTFINFLERVLGEDKELIRFVQRLVGLCLTGLTEEHILPVFYGTGANGKSTLVNVILDLLGRDYAMKAPTDFLMAKRSDSHPTEKADLFGKRFVACVETEDGRRLSESLVKELTGGDRVRARRMREDFWEFASTHKVCLVTNHRPEIRGTDHGIWRRIKLVPFDVCIPDDEQDKQLPQQLKDELPGILNWAIRGCLDWQRHGLQEPSRVMEATCEYRKDMDVLQQWIDERCEVGDNCKQKSRDLYEAYCKWCEARREPTPTSNRFARQLKEKGFATQKSGVMMRLGIQLKNRRDGRSDHDDDE